MKSSTRNDKFNLFTRTEYMEAQKVCNYPIGLQTQGGAEAWAPVLQVVYNEVIRMPN